MIKLTSAIALDETPHRHSSDDEHKKKQQTLIFVVALSVDCLAYVIIDRRSRQS